MFILPLFIYDEKVPQLLIYKVYKITDDLRILLILLHIYVMFKCTYSYVIEIRHAVFLPNITYLL